MRRLLFVSLIMLASILFVRAQGTGPDERYVGIYYMIQEADSLLAKGQLPQAAARYAEAQAALKELQSSYPSWNDRVVTYRLKYVAEKLEPLAGKIPVAPSPAAANPTATNAVAAPTTPPAEGAPAATKELQDAIARLTAQNTEMQAKLKEALSVQPAAVDPRELAKAEQKIKDLEKERDLLKTTIEQGKTAKPEQPTATAQEQAILADAKLKLAQQAELVATLQKENELLKTQLSTVKASPTELAQELMVTKLTLATMRETNIALRADAIVKEKQLEELSRNAVPRSVYAAVEKERDDLKEKVSLMSRVAGTPNPANPVTPNAANRDELAKQLELAQAKLAAFEAKPVPYTAEELAMVKPVDLRVSVTDAKPREKKPVSLPPGTDSLMKKAMLSLGTRKFADAEAQFRDVLRQDEKNVFVMTHVAWAQVQQDHLDEADKTLKAALAIDPQDPDALLVYGNLRFIQNKENDAFEALSLSAKLNPDEARTQYLLGRVLMQKGSRAAAETALRKAIQLEPGYPEAHFWLAFIYINQQPAFYELAQWHYNRAVSGGYPRDEKFEKRLEERKPATASASATPASPATPATPVAPVTPATPGSK